MATGKPIALITGVMLEMAYPDGLAIPGFVSTLETASPNDPTNAAVLAADGVADNIDAVVQPKGAGGFSLQLATGDTVGGDKRGAYAVDLQLVRSSATAVASGQSSLIIGGSDGRAEGQNSSVIGGQFGLATGFSSIVLGGDNSQANGGQAVCIGGSASRADALNSVTIGGEQSRATQEFALTLNARYGTSRNMYVTVASSGRFTRLGDAQTESVVLLAATADDTPTKMQAGGYDSETRSLIYAGQPGIWAFEATVVGTVLAGSELDTAAVYKISGAMKYSSITNDLAIMGTPTITPIAIDVAAAGWVVEVAVDNVEFSLDFIVTGDALIPINWVADLKLTEIVSL